MQDLDTVERVRFGTGVSGIETKRDNDSND
jgi:hypothetical protein